MSGLNEKDSINLGFNSSEKKYQRIISNILDVIMEIDLNGQFIYFSPQVYDVLGYQPDELIGSDGIKIVHPEDVPLLMETIRDVIKTEKIMSAEYRALHKAGHYVYVSTKGGIIRDGGRRKILAVLRDVSKRKEAEKKLKESEEKYQLITNNINDLISIFNQNFETEYRNDPVHQALLGYTPDELNNRNLLEFVHPEDRRHLIKIIRTGFKVGEGEGEFRFRKKSGDYIWLETKGRTFKDKDGENKALLISRDITNRKKVIQELKDLNDLKSEFLRRASHELKTPLISIKGYTDLILKLHREKLDIEIITMLEEIDNGCIRLEQIIKDIIESSRLESSELELHPSIENLSFLIKFCLNELKGLVKSRNHKVHLNLEENIITNINKEQIYEVITNLLSNSIKYTPLNGDIYISTVLKDEKVIVSIRDNGIGFTEKELGRVFQQFGKIERYGHGLDIGIDGTGLGLHISKKIVEMHGGKIWIESDGRNRGCTAYFSLPIIKE